MTKDQKRNEKALKLMAIHDCSYDEAMELVLYDEDVDKGVATEHDWTPEQKKASKQARRADNKKPKEVKRERKENAPKRTVMNDLMAWIGGKTERYTEVELENPERIIKFTMGDKHYTLTLTEKREKKG